MAVKRDITVLIWTPEVGAPFGGQTVQMQMTARYLREVEGISVRTCQDDQPSWDGVDVLHGMGLSPFQVREARRRRIPTVLSVIYVSKAYFVGALDRPTPFE